MSTPAKYPKQGEVYLCKASRDSGDDKIRPVVVISRAALNLSSNTVMVVPFTSDTNKWLASPLCRVVLPKGEGGLTKDSAAMCDKVRTVLKKLLIGDPLGQISPVYLEAIEKGRQVTARNKPTIELRMFGR